jgi:hypothetical protein
MKTGTVSAHMRTEMSQGARGSLCRWLFLARMSDSFQPGEVAEEEFHGGCLPFPEASAVRPRILGQEDGREHRPRPVRESSIAQGRLARRPHLGA